MSTTLKVFHFHQALFSAYAVYLSSISVSDSKQYESKAEKAAEWSNTAEHELHKTRTTLTSGTAASFCSFVTSLNLLLIPTTIPTWLKLTLNTANVVTTLAAEAHIRGYWSGKAKVPLVDQYNEAISTTNQLRILLWCLAGIWTVTSAITGVMELRH